MWAVSSMTFASPNSLCYPKTIKAAWHKALPDHVSGVLVSTAQVPSLESRVKCSLHRRSNYQPEREGEPDTGSNTGDPKDTTFSAVVSEGCMPYILTYTESLEDPNA